MEGMPAVTFHFGGDYEIQYSSHVPEVGDRVTHAGAIWTVVSVENTRDGVVAKCTLGLTQRVTVGVTF
jgi:hypothetical protein